MEDLLDELLGKSKIMIVFRNKRSDDGSVSYTERDGDVSFNELYAGMWQLRATDFGNETKTFGSYKELEEFMLQNWKLAGIIVFK